MKYTKRKSRVASKDTQAKVMRAFRQCVDKMSADRPAYVAQFFGLWEGAVKSVSRAAELMLEHQAVDFSKEAWKELLAPYDTLSLMMFARLMDRLNLDEEERYLAACAALDAAWQKFFAFVRGRHPDGAEVFDRLEAARHAAHDAVLPLFTGEAQPVLTPAWANAYMTLENGFGDFAKAVAK